MHPRRLRLAVSITALGLAGCSEVSLLFRERLPEAATAAVTDTYTWAPLAGAAVMTIGNADNRAANSLYHHNPVFGSVSRAQKNSDDMKTAVTAMAYASSLLAPVDCTPTNLLADSLSLAVTSTATNGLKDATRRERPDQSNDLSFPSGHASQAFAAARIVSDNLDYYDLGDNTRLGLRIGAYTLAAGTGWARIEAGKHHPADVLAGAALGNAVTVFFRHLMKEDSPVEPQVTIDPADQAFMLGLAMPF